MFIVGGFNAHPAEVEGFLMEQPAVAQAPLSASLTNGWDRSGKAFVITKAPVTADELIAWSKTRTAGLKVPRPRPASHEGISSASARCRPNHPKYTRCHATLRRKVGRGNLGDKRKGYRTWRSDNPST